MAEFFQVFSGIALIADTTNGIYGRCHALFEDRFPFSRLLGSMEDWSELGWVVKVTGMLVAFLPVRSWSDSQRSLYGHIFHLISRVYARGWGHALGKVDVRRDWWKNQDDFLMFYIALVFTISLLGAV